MALGPFALIFGPCSNTCCGQLKYGFVLNGLSRTNSIGIRDITWVVQLYWVKKELPDFILILYI